MSASKKKLEPKHPRKMTTDEAVKHLFHPDVVSHAQKHIVEAVKPKKKST